MRQVLKKFTALFLITLALLVPAAITYADDGLLTGACTTAEEKSSSVCTSRDPKTNPLINIIQVAVNIIALVTGAAAVVMIVISGFTMVTSAGNTESIANSRKRITFAIVGLAIVSFAWLIVTFAVDKLIKN